MSKNKIIVAAGPDRGAFKDPEALGLALHQQVFTLIMHIVKLVQTWLIETEGKMAELAKEVCAFQVLRLVIV